MDAPGRLRQRASSRRSSPPRAPTLLASHGFRVLLSDRPVPTPCASWHVASRGLRAGLAITASHNPPLWNGVKVKSSFGGSATPATYDAIARAAGPARPQKGRGLRRDARPRDAVSRRARGPRRSRRDPQGRPAGFSSTRSTERPGRCSKTIVGAGHPTTVVSLRANRDPLFGGVNPEPIPENLAAAQRGPRVGALRRRPRERRGRRPARRAGLGRPVRHAAPRPRAPRREPHGSRAHPRRHREDVLDVAAPRPRRLAPRRAAPRHAGRLQAHRREDALRRGRDRRRGVGRPGRRVPPARARRRPLGAPRPGGDRALGRHARDASSPGRTRPTARSRTAAATSICRCRCCAPSSRA